MNIRETRWIVPRNIFQGRYLNVLFIFILLFRWFCGFEKPLIYVAKDMKVIFESVHLILTLFNWSGKLLLESRQCSIFLEILNVCHYASKGILFLVLLAEVFPTIHWLIRHCLWNGHSVLLGTGHAMVDEAEGVRGAEHRACPHGAHILRDERAEVVWKENSVFICASLYFSYDFGNENDLNYNGI